MRLISRRDFVGRSSLAAAALATQPLLSGENKTGPATEFDPNRLAKFVDRLPVPPVARPAGSRPDPTARGRELPYYSVRMQPAEIQVHRDLAPTRFWTFDGLLPGPTFETRSGEGILVEWKNALPAEHFLPIDHKIHGAEPDKPRVRAVVHLHGAKVPPESDGYPEDWIVPGKSAIYHYPNQQDAAMLWYHDHALGINRLNVYAGLVGTFLVRDSLEDALQLPRGEFEIPLVLFDRLFTRDAQLLYPVSRDPDSPWVSEVYGNAILANGRLFPYLDVAPRKYRFRILNASNGRFYNLSLSTGAEFHQTGTDQGLLASTVPLKHLVVAPGERADLIVDFSGQRGEQIVLRSEPFEILQFRVSNERVRDESLLPPSLKPVPRIAEAQAARTRLLTLEEFDNSAGEPVVMLLNAVHWNMPITEKPALHSTEIWSLMNPSDDSHPIHLHGVRFQILDRRRYEPWLYRKNKEIRYLSPPLAPDPNEAGWKDTVRADSRMITRIIVPFEGFAGRYVWHCHILEHEDNEMMRPFEIVGDGSAP